MSIQYITGDATDPKPQQNELSIIVHICNDIGAWGAGFVLALSKRWDLPESEYRSNKPYILGNIQLIPVESNIIVCNLIGQHGIYKGKYKLPPIRYEAVRDGLTNLANKIKQLEHTNNITVHMPRIGCGLAGGNWAIVEDIIIKTLINNKIPVYVYTPTLK